MDRRCRGGDRDGVWEHLYRRLHRHRTDRFCAKQAAGAAMVTAGEFRVNRVVAVWRDSREGPDSPLFVLPPCGVCRWFLCDVDPSNAEADVLLSGTEVVRLRELL